MHSNEFIKRNVVTIYPSPSSFNSLQFLFPQAIADAAMGVEKVLVVSCCPKSRRFPVSIENFFFFIIFFLSGLFFYFFSFQGSFFYFFSFQVFFLFNFRELYLGIIFTTNSGLFYTRRSLGLSSNLLPRTFCLKFPQNGLGHTRGKKTK